MMHRGIVLISSRTLLAEALAASLTKVGWRASEIVRPSSCRTGLARLSRPAVIVIDAYGNVARLAALVDTATTAFPAVPVAVLADGKDPETVATVRAAGANALLGSDIGTHAFSEACRLVALGVRIFPPGIACEREIETRPAPEVPSIQMADPLSGRESEILATLTEGLSNKEIARRLDISEATVKTHLKGIMRKTGAANRTQAALWARERGVGMGARPVVSRPGVLRNALSQVEVGQVSRAS